MLRTELPTERVPSIVPSEQPCKFGTLVRAAFPHKPALNLAQRMGNNFTERGAQFIIDGERKASLDAWLALIQWERE